MKKKIKHRIKTYRFKDITSNDQLSFTSLGVTPLEAGRNNYSRVDPDRFHTFDLYFAYKTWLGETSYWKVEEL